MRTYTLVSVLMCLFSAVAREEETTQRFHLAPNKMTRAEGLTWCADQGMGLVVPQSREDMRELRNLVSQSAWLGIERDESDLSRWINTNSREPLTYTNWNGREGNKGGRQKVAIMRFDRFAGRWFDWHREDLNYHVICDSEQTPYNEAELPTYRKNCRWEETKDDNLANTAAYIGWTCKSNEILTGFEVQATEDDVTKVQCCELGGHSSVVPDTCKFVDFKDPELFDPEQASCKANDHMVFSGVYDERIAEGDGYTEIKVGKCCEVKCDAPWCAGKDWGVNTEQCQTISKDPKIRGKQELVCPKGHLLTQIHDGHTPDEDSPHAIQRIESVVCCALDVIAKPTKAPTTSPTPSPTISPSPSPTDMPSTSPSPSPTDMPSTSPSPSPTDMPSTSPTTAPTTKGECLLALRCVPDMTKAEWLAAIKECCENSDNHRRALTGRLLPEDIERMM